MAIGEYLFDQMGSAGEVVEDRRFADSIFICQPTQADIAKSLLTGQRKHAENQLFLHRRILTDRSVGSQEAFLWKYKSYLENHLHFYL